MLLTKAVKVAMNSVCQGLLVNGLELVTQGFRSENRFLFYLFIFNVLMRREIIRSAVLFLHVLRTSYRS